TASAALESGFDPNKKLRVDDPYQPDKSWGDYFVRSASHAHGDFNMADGFRLSENIYFAQVGLAIGSARLTDYAKRFGVGAAPKLTTMLVGAVSVPGGFAFGAKIPGENVAGKTGTAENRPGEAPHGWFIGFAPAEAPTVVVAVIVENTAEGGLTAAPLGAQVIRAALGK